MYFTVVFQHDLASAAVRDTLKVFYDDDDGGGGGIRNSKSIGSVHTTA